MGAHGIFGALEALRFGTLQFELVAVDRVRLPRFLGSTLRGALGWALKALACPLRCATAAECPLAEPCAYASLFETRAPPGSPVLRNAAEVPRPLIVRPPAPRDEPWTPDDVLRFDVLLVGRALGLAPLVARAVQDMAHAGLGPAGERFRVREASVTPEVHTGAELLTDEPRDSATLEFITPVRIVDGGRLTAAPGFHAVARALLTRVPAMLYFHCGQRLEADFRALIDLARTAERTTSSLRLVQLSRWSNDQGSHVPLDGVVGRVGWHGPAVRALWPMLRAGEALHVGKNTTYGLGRYEIDEAS